jgi:toxin-antitoxin system PIN domain toxin
VSALLLDVNVLIALSWKTHPHYAAARAWFKARPVRRWATCPMTECGYVRLSSNPRLVQGAASVREAVESLRRLRAGTAHEFWLDDASLADEPLFERLRGHQQVTDAYLLALAARRKGKLATFDQALSALAESAGMSKHILQIAA